MKAFPELVLQFNTRRNTGLLHNGQAQAIATALRAGPVKPPEQVRRIQGGFPGITDL